MKQLFTLISCWFSITTLLAQGEANNWYFGGLAGVTFNSGTPVALTNGALSTSEGCASMSDKNGQLLFYTDGINVWNRNHILMPNGTGLFGDPSSAQSAIIVPRPGNPNRFYIFTVAAQGNPAGFCYSEVDLSLNGGLGDVLTANKNTQLFTPSVEKCAAVKHANGLYIWVLAHGFNNNTYYAYLVDCNGINTPVISNVGSVEGWPGWGCMTASPNGQKIATAMRSVGFEVLDFNNSTGVLSNPINLGQNTDCYGISFSPDNNLLYGLQITTGNMYQWNLQAGSPAAIVGSMYYVGLAPGNASPYRGGAMQIGPDGKIYIPHYGQPFLAAITNPNAIGAACAYQTNVVDLQGRNAILGLPPFIQSYFSTTATITYSNDTCAGSPVTFGISSNTSALDSVKWNFGDPASGAANASTLLSPVHTFANPGIYNVQLIRYQACVVDTTTIPLHIFGCTGTPIAGIINDYTPVTAIDVCTNTITVGSASAFSAGDRVLLIQMKGATINQANSSAFGDVQAYNNAGNYEMATIASISGNNITFVNKILKSYTVADAVQLVRVPQYTDAYISSPVTCLPWNGSIGGIVALEASGTVTLNADIDASDKGFRAGVVSLNQPYVCDQTDYFYDISSANGGRKGEGIFELPTSIINGRGKNANGGGGGNNTNSGGAGGGNGGGGGRGGDQWGGCAALPIGGDGGLNLSYTNAAGKIFLGGGAGGGHQNNATATPGTNGAGIILVNSNQLIANGGGLKSFSNNSQFTDIDGSGGAGAGGTVLVTATTITGNLSIDVHGGNGGDNNGHGPGGGGGGGVVWSTNPLPVNVTVTATGGAAGFDFLTNTNRGAQAGQNGLTLSGLVIPESGNPFSLLDTPVVTVTTPVCQGNTLAFTLTGNYSSTATYSWTSGTGFTSSQRNPSIASATPANTGNYTVVVTDSGCSTPPVTISATVFPVYNITVPQSICPNSSYTLPGGSTVNTSGTYIDTLSTVNGCDSVITTNLTVLANPLSVSGDVAICLGDSTTLSATGGAFGYTWTPATGLSDPAAANPVASPLSTTTYVVSTQFSSGNLIVNGDFNAGNTGFSSNYVYTFPNTGEGEIYVGPNAQAWNGGMSACPDHTTGTGNMLCVNGSVQANNPVYCQTVNVTPNTDYAFSTWLATLTAGNLAQLQFSINNNLLGSIFNAPATPCQWQQFYELWNSGPNTTATICVVNQNTNAGANDFALDDIAFSPLCTVTDTITVTVNNPYLTVIDTAICEGIVYTFPGGNTSTVSVTDTALLTTVNGCDSTVITNLTVHPSPVTTVYDTICANQSYTLPLGNTVNTTGIYNDTLTTVNGCDSVVITYLTVHPVYAITVLDTICIGNTYTLPDGSSVTAGGSYPITLITVNGCDSVVTTQLTVLDVTATAQPTGALCFGDANGSFVATATGGVTPYTYSTSLSGTVIGTNSSGQFQNLAAGNYTVDISDSYSCSTTISVTVAEPSLLTATGTVQNITCFGEGNGIISLTAQGGTPGYTYSLSNAGINSTGVFQSLESGNYPYTVTDANNCTATGNLSVNEPAAITANILPQPAEVELGSSLPLTAQSNYPNAVFTWSPSVGLSCTTCPDPVFEYNNSVPYSITVSVDINGNTCYAYLNQVVEVIPKYDLFIPNVFSPNDDGANDFFEVYGNKPAIKHFDLSIFNRIGEKVFHTYNVNFKWDGWYKGASLPPGVYTYALQVVFTDNHAPALYKGSVTLLR